MPFQSIPYAPRTMYEPRYGQSIADLLVRQGEIAGQGQLQSGMIWANALGNLGQIAGGAVEQYQQQKIQKKREQAFKDVLGTWDPQDPRGSIMRLSSVIGPEDAMKFGAGLATLEATIRKNQEGQIPSAEEVKTAVVAAHVLKKNSPGMFAQQYPNLRAQFGPAFKKHFGYDLPESLTPEVEQGLDALAEQWSPKGPNLQPVTTKEGIQPFNPQAGTLGPVIGQPPPRAEPAPAKTLAEIEAESAARARGTRAGAPPEEPQGTWTQAEDAEGKPVLLNTATGQTKPYPAGVMPKPAATEANRIAASNAALEASSEVRNYIKANQKVLGALMGRYESLMAAAGVGDPVATKLIGMLMSYSSLQPQIHGFRSAQFVDKIQQLINIKQNPDALIAGIEGVDTAARAVSNRGRTLKSETPEPTPAGEPVKRVIFNPKTGELEPAP